MATQALTSSFLSVTVSPVAIDWSTITGSYIQTALSTTDFTETVTFQGTHTFSEDVTISGVNYSVSGNLSAGGISSAQLYLYAGSVGSISSTFTFTGAVSVSNWSLVGRVLTVEITVMGSPYSGSPPTLRVNNPTFTVTYEPLPVLHNLGINF